MKALDIALKDMRQSFRSKGAIVFMFVIPILITVLFSFMFGSIAGDDEGFAFATIPVVVVNLDQGQAYFLQRKFLPQNNRQENFHLQRSLNKFQQPDQRRMDLPD